MTLSFRFHLDENRKGLVLFPDERGRAACVFSTPRLATLKGVSAMKFHCRKIAEALFASFRCPQGVKIGGPISDGTQSAGAAEDVARLSRKYQALGISHLRLSGTSCRDEIESHCSQLLPLPA